MNVRNIYSNRHLIPEANHDMFEKHRKPELNQIELVGLEAVLAAFIQQYEEEAYGEVYSKNITDYIRYIGDCVDILDGVHDTYIFDNYAIGHVWMTDNGIPMLSCFLLESNEYDDPYEIVCNTDWMIECKHVLFRLD